jgi:gamma-glutamyltranspeptidase
MVNYKGIDVYKLQAWTQGPSLLQALNIVENFDLKKFLTERKLLKEEITPDVEDYLINLHDLTSSEDYEEGEEISSIFQREEYGDPEAYDDAEMFDKAYNEIKQQGGSIKIEGQPDITFSTHGEDIKVDLLIEY